MVHITVSFKPVENQSEQPAFVVQLGWGQNRFLGAASVKKFYNPPQHSLVPLCGLTTGPAIDCLMESMIARIYLEKFANSWPSCLPPANLLCGSVFGGGRSSLLAYDVNFTSELCGWVDKHLGDALKIFKSLPTKVTEGTSYISQFYIPCQIRKLSTWL